jgi:hypothetical protein
MDYIIREIAESMDLDADKVVNSFSEAAVQAEVLKKFQEANPQAAPQPQGGPPADPNGNGGGTIGTGAPVPPGEAGFSGNEGGGGAPAQGGGELEASLSSYLGNNGGGQ